MPHRVAFLGFTESERHALSSYFRLAHQRSPSYTHVATLTDADLLVADADHAPSVQLVLVTERQDETVFVGAQAPAAGAAWMRRPIDALQVLRELDGIVGRRIPAQAARHDAGQHTTIIQAMHRRSEAAAEPEGAQLLLGDLPFSAADPAVTARAAAVASGSGPLTLRDPPTPAVAAPGAPPLPDHFPGSEGLVGHEPPLPVQPGAWTEDLPVLHELAPVAVAVPRKAAKPPKVPKATLLPGTPRALLVDDSAIARLFLEKRLERWQMQTDHASNSQVALALMAQNSYDLVFLDVELGADSELDGLALCRQIKQTPASMNALVVMVSAHHSELDRVRGSLAGCDAYLGKPLDVAELQRLLQRQGLRVRAEAGPVAH